MFKMPNGTKYYTKMVDGEMYNKTIDMKCTQDPQGGAPSFQPFYDHLINPFPECVFFRKLAYFIFMGSTQCIRSESSSRYKIVIVNQVSNGVLIVKPDAGDGTEAVKTPPGLFMGIFGACGLSRATDLILVLVHGAGSGAAL